MFILQGSFLLTLFQSLKFLLAGLLTLALSACFSASPTLPEWVSQKPLSSDFYYAVGQGVNLYDAEVNARASLAAELSSTVNDLTKIYSSVDGKFQQHIYEQFTSVEVSKVNISNARITKQQDNGKGYYVLLELDKRDLAKQLKSELPQLNRLVELVLKDNRSKSFEHWWKLRRVLSDVKRLTRNIQLLEKIEVKTYLKEARLSSRYFSLLDKSYGERRLEIKDLSDTDSIKELVSKALQTESISQASSLLWSTNDFIEISKEYRRQKIGQEYYVDATLWLRLKTATGQLLSEYNLEERGVSYSSSSKSQSVADQRLYAALTKTDIFDSLLKQSGL